MDKESIVDNLESLYAFVRLHQWCAQTDAKVRDLLALSDGLGTLGRQRLRHAVQSSLKQRMTTEEQVVSFVLLRKAGVPPLELANLAYDQLQGRLTDREVPFILTHLYGGRKPLPSDLTYDIERRVYLSIRRALWRATNIRSAPSTVSAEDTTLYLILVLCLSDLNEQNRAIIFFLLCRVDVDLPARLRAQMTQSARTIAEAIDAVEQDKEGALSNESAGEGRSRVTPSSRQPIAGDRRVPEQRASAEAPSRPTGETLPERRDGRDAEFQFLRKHVGGPSDQGEGQFAASSSERRVPTARGTEQAPESDLPGSRSEDDAPGEPGGEPDEALHATTAEADSASTSQSDTVEGHGIGAPDASSHVAGTQEPGSKPTDKGDIQPTRNGTVWSADRAPDGTDAGGAPAQGFVIRFTRTDEDVAEILDEIAVDTPPIRQTEEGETGETDEGEAVTDRSPTTPSRRLWWVLAAVAAFLVILTVALLASPRRYADDTSFLPFQRPETTVGVASALRGEVPERPGFSVPVPNCPVGWNDLSETVAPEPVPAEPAPAAHDRSETAGGKTPRSADLTVPPRFRVDDGAEMILWFPRRGDSLWKLHSYLQAAEDVPYPALTRLGQTYWQLFLSRVKALNPGLAEPDLIIPSQPIRLSPVPDSG